MTAGAQDWSKALRNGYMQEMECSRSVSQVYFSSPLQAFFELLKLLFNGERLVVVDFQFLAMPTWVLVLSWPYDTFHLTVADRVSGWFSVVCQPSSTLSLDPW